MTVSDFLRSPFEIDILHFDCFGIEEIPSFDEHLIFSSAGNMALQKWIIQNKVKSGSGRRLFCCLFVSKIHSSFWYV